MEASEQNKRLAQDAFLMAIPDDAYDPCPCGCGKKWRFVVKGGEAEIKKHEQTFIVKWLKGN